MKVMYYPQSMHVMLGVSNEKDDPKPCIQWGVVEDWDNDSNRVCFYEYAAIPLYLINGQTCFEFVTEENWHKLPKNWDYDMDLVALHTEDLPNKSEILIAVKNCKISDPKSILKLIELGHLYKKDIYNYNIESEVDNKKYRIVKKAPYYSTIYGKMATSYFMPKKELFESYEEALLKAKDMIADWGKSREEKFIIDVENAKHFILNSLPVEHKEKCELLLSTLYYGYYFSMRFYKGEILFKNGFEKNYRVIYSTKE